MIKKLLLIIACLCYSSISLAKIFIEMDFEQGKIPYVGSSNKHPGGGYIGFLGGEVGGGVNPGDGTQYYGDYTNVILDGSSDAKNSIDGSNYSLKTQYRVGHERSFQKNTTVIKFPNTRNVYVRWYQKWSKSWEWPTDQQKLLKHQGRGQSGAFKLTGGNAINLVKKNPPPRENLTQTYVYAQQVDERPGRLNDSVPDNSKFRLDTNRWYCIETMIKSSPYKESKGEFAYWIDDDLKLYLKDSFNFVEGADSKYPDFYEGGGGYYYGVEMQHVYQLADGRTTVDMPTWMDNIVISDQRIGCSGKPKAPPKPPTPFDQ